MRLFLTGLTLLAAVCMLAPAGDAFAPKPPNFVPGVVAFRDAPGDKIRSDNGTAYADNPDRRGGQGLEVRVWTGGSQDVTLGTFNSGRQVRYDNYAPATDVTQPSGTTTPPSGTLLDNSFVNVRNIASMAVGETMITRASFSTAIGYFRWLGAPNPSNGSTTDPMYGAQAVVVARTSATTWDVRTPVPSEPWYQLGTPAADFDAGDLAILLKDAPKGALAPVALYHLPWGMTVTCPSCTWP